MPPAPAGTPRRDDCSQRHCRTRDEHPNLGQPELNSNYQSPPGPLSPAQADYRLTVARLKDALRAPAYAGQILDPAARSHEPAAIRGKHNQRGSYPTPGKHGRSAKPQVIPT
jgi:hypothetical protein